VLGIDDFSLRRGDSYGTILINLETRRPLDLLPDRTAEAVKPWLASHPEIQVVSRDRASAFADAVDSERVLQRFPESVAVAMSTKMLSLIRDTLGKSCSDSQNTS